MKLRVGVSMVGLSAERTTGLERFGLEFIRAMREHCSDRIQVVPIVHEWAARELGGDCLVVPRGLARPVAIELWLPAALKRSKLDWLHGVCYGFPGQVRNKYSLTIQDLIPWESPTTTSKGTRLYFKPLMERSMKSPNLASIVTTTHISQQKVLDRFMPACQVDVIPIGVSKDWFNGKNSRTVQGGEGKESAPLRILTVGTLEPRKGIDTISRAAARLVAESFEFEWRVVGRAGWGEIDLSAQLTALGRIDDDELRRQYRWADVVVSASRDEGFNLPAAEGLAAGASLLLSDIPVHAELYRQVADIFPTDDPRALVDGLYRAKKQKLETEDASKQAAYNRMLKKFSWERVANSYCDLWIRASVGGNS